MESRPAAGRGRFSTDPGPPDHRRVRRARNVRRAFIGLLVVFLGLGAAGVFGARTGLARASGGGYEVVVTYPAVTRPGLAIRYEITVRHEGGLSSPIELATTSDYLELFDDNALDPEPTDSLTDGERTIWTFDRFSGSVLTVSLDARTEPARSEGASGVTTLSVGGVELVTVRYRTWVMP